MNHISRTRTAAGGSDSDPLALDRLTGGQKEAMRYAVGAGLWEEILLGQPLAGSTLDLIRRKLTVRGLLRRRMTEFC